MHAKRPAEAPTDPVLTPRLVLTPVGPDDVNDLLLLYSDPVVAYWTGPWSRAAVEAWAATGRHGTGTNWTALPIRGQDPIVKLTVWAAVESPPTKTSIVVVSMTQSLVAAFQ